MAFGVPALFELALGLGFGLQVHEQAAVSVLVGMTLPCVTLMLSSLVLAWFIMPYVAMINTGVLVFAVTALCRDAARTAPVSATCFCRSI